MYLIISQSLSRFSNVKLSLLAPRRMSPTRYLITLQRHFSVLTKFAHVESRLSESKRQREVALYAPVTSCSRRACPTSVAVGTTIPAHSHGTSISHVSHMVC